MKKKIVTFLLLVCVITSTFISTAFAQTYDCPKCAKKTTWNECCSKRSAGNSGYSQHTIADRVCNYYYSDGYNARRCSQCSNLYVYTKKHTEKVSHTICATQYCCPY